MAEGKTELDQLFEQLNGHVENEQDKKALKAAEQILAIEPSDQDALKCKIISYIKLSQYDDALMAISKAGFTDSMAFEKAYCLYRLGKMEEALKAAQSGPEDQVAARMQLQAQLHFRLGHSKECIRLYDVLFQQLKVDTMEVKTNVIAAYVLAELCSEIPALMTAMKVSAKDSFELGFNRACGLAGNGNYAAAETELRLAMKLARETLLSEEYSEEEVETELAPFNVQLAYILSKLGKRSEAQELNDSVVKSERSDVASKAVATANLVVDCGRLDGGAQNKKYVGNCIKRIEALLEDADSGLKFAGELETRLSPSQKLALHVNRALLYLLVGKVDQAKSVLAALCGVSECADVPALVLANAAVLVRENKVAEADAMLSSFISRGAHGVIEATLMRAQIASDRGEHAVAAELLGGLQAGGLAMSGAVLATRVALMEQLGDTQGAEKLLEAALAHWRQQPSGTQSATAQTWCVQQLVRIQLKLGKTQAAAQAYKHLQDAGVTTAAGLEVLAKLMRSLAAADPSAVASLSRGLPPMALSKDLNTDTLEDFTRVSMPTPKRDQELSKKRDADAMEVDGASKAKKPKKKKPRYPKGYNPALPNGGLPPPDPERWLPKWERSDFKKKNRRRRGDKEVKGSQGAGKVDENLDISKKAVGEGKAATSAKPTLPPRKGGKKK